MVRKLVQYLIRVAIITAVVWAVVVSIKSISIAKAQLGRVSPHTICWTDGTVSMSAQSVDAVKVALFEAINEVDFHDAQCFAPVDLRDEGEWVFVTIVGLINLDPTTQWSVAENGVWSDNVILHFNASGPDSAVAGTAAFSELLNQIPEEIVSAQSKEIIDPRSDHQQNRHTVEAYRFPFEFGYQVHYGTKGGGVHPGEFSGVLGGTSIAVDLISDGDTSSNHAPNRLLAVAPGTVVKKCSNTSMNSTYIVIDSGSTEFLYAHIRSSTAPPLWSTVSSSGDYIGEMVPGTFDDYPCGYTTGQSANYFHVHLEFLSTPYLTLSEWTLDTSSEVWRKGEETWNAGEWKRIGGGSPPPPPPPSSNCQNYSYNGVVLFDQKQCAGSKAEYGNSTNLINLPDVGWNDRAASVHIGSGWSVRVWEHDNSNGATRCLTGSMWDLSVDKYDGSDTYLNTTITSIQVYNNGSCTNSSPPPSSSVKLYDAPYQGGNIVWQGGVGEYSGLGANSYRLEIPSGWSVWTYRENNFGGSSRCWNQSVPNLQDHEDWQNKIRSIKVYSFNVCPTSPPPPPSGGEWEARYFNNRTCWDDHNQCNNAQHTERIAVTGGTILLDKNWDRNAPGGNVGQDNWTGYFKTTINFSPGSYVFYADHDDGLLLKFGDYGQHAKDSSGSESKICNGDGGYTLSGNVPIELYLREDGGEARLKLWWSADTSVCIPTPTPTFTPTPTPTFTPTATPTPTLPPSNCTNWSVIGTGNGHWHCQGDTVQGHSSSGDSILVSQNTYQDVTISASASSTNREASLAVRLQDAGNGYLAIFIPDGIGWNNGSGGLWLAKRVANSEQYIGYFHEPGFPVLGEATSFTVSAIGSSIQVRLDGELVLNVVDTTFTSGSVGFRIYGDSAFPNDASYADVSITQPLLTPTPTVTATRTPTAIPTATRIPELPSQQLYLPDLSK